MRVRSAGAGSRVPRRIAAADPALRRRANKAVAAEFGVHERTVGKWRRRFLKEPSRGCWTMPRPGRPRTKDEQVARVIERTLSATPADATHWSLRSIARESGLSTDPYEMLEAESYFYAIRLRTNRVLQGKIAHLLKRPVGRPPNHVRRTCGDFQYQAASWDKPRRVIAKVEWPPGELFPRVGFVVTNMPMEADWIIQFYNQRGTAEQHIKEGKQAINWTRLSCKGMAQNRSAFSFTHWPTISVSSCKAHGADQASVRAPRG